MNRIFTFGAYLCRILAFFVHRNSVTPHKKPRLLLGLHPNVKILLNSGTVKVFSFLWRLAVVLLPWQTRWFADISLLGWPWEQGRWSIYASWVLLIAVSIVGASVHNPHYPRGEIKNEPPLKIRGGWGSYGLLGFLLLLSLLAVKGNVLVLRAVLQWWVQVLILGLFVWTLIRSRIPAQEIIAWLVVSLVPQAILAIVQYATQHVVGSSWLGMSSQLPETLGVSVIAHDGLRILRAYGGFPHPNILGGWLAVGWLGSLFLANKKRSWILVSILSSLALFLTYSRSAWIAALLGVGVWIAAMVGSSVRRRAGDIPRLRRFLVLVFFSLLAVFLLAFTQRSHLLTRLQTATRLEAKSIDVRAESLRSGWQTFLRHPWIGTGPNAELPQIVAQMDTVRAESPLESPHNVFLLFIVNFGIVGTGVVLLFCFWNREFISCLFVHPFALSICACLVMLGMVDHYLWSFWSGQALLAVAVLTVGSVLGKIDAKPD